MLLTFFTICTHAIEINLLVWLVSLKSINKCS